MDVPMVPRSVKRSEYLDLFGICSDYVHVNSCSDRTEKYGKYGFPDKKPTRLNQTRRLRVI